MSPAEFNAFPAQALTFLHDLHENNNRDWFEAHKGDYIAFIREPAQGFVAVLGARLQEIAPDVVIDTRTNGSGNLLRINRDTRFSKDKSPYKTNISMWFWQGAGKKMQQPGFGMQIEPDGAGLAVGLFNFDKPFMAAYQAAVAHDRRGPALVAALKAIGAAGEYTINGEQYKRVPSGYDSEHPRAEWLKYKGLWVSSPRIAPAAITSADFVDVCMQHFKLMAPVQRWLVEVMEHATD